MNNPLWGRLIASGVDAAMERIGLDFKKLFGDASLFACDPYRDHMWLVKENDEFLVVNAIPARENLDRLFWEEWYLNNDEVHHHVLTVWRPGTYDEVFHAPQSDGIHPEPCFGSTWYVIEDPDMTPWLLRR